jgi:predicted nucleotidyltransferase
MNQTSKSYLHLAQKNARCYLNNPNVKAIVITGSVALGYADDFSDIDTLIFYEEKINEKNFEKIVNDAKSSGGDLHGGDAEHGFAVYEYIDGIRCDFSHGYLRETEQIITNMVNNPDNDMIKQLIVFGFTECISLFGEQWVDKWKQIASGYPDKLAELMIKEHLRFYPKWVLDKMVLERNDVVFLYDILIQSIKDIITVLCGLNRLYYHGKLKNVGYFIEKMKIKPVNLEGRMDNILKSGSKASVDELYRIIGEVLTLVETNDINIDIDTLRTRNTIKMVLRK